MSINKELKSAGLTERTGLVIYLKNASDQYKLRRFGDIVYFSKKMKYCIVYVTQENAKQELAEIRKLDFVKYAEFSEKDQVDLSSSHIETQIATMAQEAEQEIQRRQEKNEDLLK
ncbi:MULTISPECIES: YlbG family protein [Lactobacillus]|uniref:DUF2129 domain-containing protein n=1 Tax=Lactobacillus xujianguonis TaxID=2495899 RepID=A0A437SV17_9LACO|nr:MULTISPECIES: YlbG family protein [Lactobacillus]RVU70657.1 DUF2129 domain-containing protein [Lactobacillus xujianguonis]RVU73257.1 DUF2129 domain-containing protein [Lactobacillus xujianguonis]